MLGSLLACQKKKQAIAQEEVAPSEAVTWFQICDRFFSPPPKVQIAGESQQVKMSTYPRAG